MGLRSNLGSHPHGINYTSMEEGPKAAWAVAPCSLKQPSVIQKIHPEDLLCTRPILEPRGLGLCCFPSGIHLTHWFLNQTSGSLGPSKIQTPCPTFRTSRSVSPDLGPGSCLFGKCLLPQGSECFLGSHTWSPAGVGETALLFQQAQLSWLEWLAGVG